MGSRKDGRCLFRRFMSEICDRMSDMKGNGDRTGRSVMFETLFESAPDAVFIADTGSGKLVDCNRNAVKLIGRPKEEILKMKAAELHPKDRREMTMRAFDRQAKGESLFVDTEVLTASGSRVPVEIYSSLVAQGDGKLLVGTFRDVTERKRSEAALSERDERLRKLAVQVPGMIYQFVAKPGGGYYIPFASDAIKTLFGVTAANASEDATPIFEAIVKEDVAGVTASIEESARRMSLWQYEFRVKVGDGPVKWLLAKSKPERLPDGSIVWNGFVTDVTERKRIEERDKRLDELKDRFIKVVSHQLRTPLSVVRWSLEEAMDGEVRDPAQMMRAAYEANTEVIARIGDMVVALEIEQGRMRLEKENAYLEELVDAVSRRLAARASVRGIKLIRGFPAKRKTPVFADVERTNDAISRLLDNAIAYTERGGTVRLDVDLTGKRVRFTVTDTGIGVSDESKTEIFERFYRGANAISLRPNASGLGLYITKHVIEAHGGRIGFESEMGKGSSFWFELPMKVRRA